MVHRSHLHIIALSLSLLLAACGLEEGGGAGAAGIVGDDCSALSSGEHVFRSEEIDVDKTEDFADPFVPDPPRIGDEESDEFHRIETGELQIGFSDGNIFRSNFQPRNAFRRVFEIGTFEIQDDGETLVLEESEPIFPLQETEVDGTHEFTCTLRGNVLTLTSSELRFIEPFRIPELDSEREYEIEIRLERET